MTKKKKQEKRTINRRNAIIWGLFAFAVISSLVAEKFIQLHPVGGIDGRTFFHAWFGFMSCTIFVLFSKFLGFFLKRQEGYYKENR